MLWMTIYHFCFDLNHFGFIQQNFYTSPLWTWQRTGILSLFLFCVGWSQSQAQLQSPRFLWTRWLQIALCAALVSAGSYWMYPTSFIYFGVLHAVCVMLLLMHVLRPLGEWLWLVGAGCVGLFLYPPFVMNAAPWNVLGLISQKPITQDYVPLLPWLALVCWGYAFGLWTRPIKQKGPSSSLSPFIRPLAVLGRYSLPYYMAHQPILIGLLYLCRLA